MTDLVRISTVVHERKRLVLDVPGEPREGLKGLWATESVNALIIEHLGGTLAWSFSEEETGLYEGRSPIGGPLPEPWATFQRAVDALLDDTCSECRGDGSVVLFNLPEPCRSCDGTGKVTRE